MTTNSITSGTSTASALSALAAMTASSVSRSQRAPGHVQTAAEALGTSTSDVTAALESGKSLLDLADDQGVSRGDLLAALEAGAPDDLKNSDDADARIEALASQTGVGGVGGVGGPGGGRGGPPPAGATTGVLSGDLTSTPASTLSTLSDLLGTDASSLLEQLRSGGDLSQVLSDGGVSLDQLSAGLEEGLLVDTRA